MEGENQGLFVAILCRNAKNFIQPFAAHVRAVCGGKAQIIIVDEASADGTTTVLEGDFFGIANKLVYISPQSEKNAGLAAAAAAFTGDYIVVHRAILGYDPKDYPALIAPLLNGSAGAAMARPKDEESGKYIAENMPAAAIVKMLNRGVPGAFCPAAFKEILQNQQAEVKNLVFVPLAHRAQTGQQGGAKAGRRSKKSRRKGKKS